MIGYNGLMIIMMLFPIIEVGASLFPISFLYSAYLHEYWLEKIKIKLSLLAS